MKSRAGMTSSLSSLTPNLLLKSLSDVNRLLRPYSPIATHIPVRADMSGICSRKHPQNPDDILQGVGKIDDADDKLFVKGLMPIQAHAEQLMQAVSKEAFAQTSEQAA